MQLSVTEHKSEGQLAAGTNTVRVFVNHDYHYGYFVEERALLDLLGPGILPEYLKPGTFSMDVSIEVAQRIIDMGDTPYTKPTLR